MTAGAPKKPYLFVKIPVGLKLPKWIVLWMREQDESMPVIIEKAVCEIHNLKHPSLINKDIKNERSE